MVIMSIIVSTIFCIMMMGHYFCSPIGYPVKRYSEKGLFWCAVTFTITSVINSANILLTGPTTIQYIGIWINVASLVIICTPVLYGLLVKHRESFKKYKDY